MIRGMPGTFLFKHMLKKKVDANRAAVAEEPGEPAHLVFEGVRRLRFLRFERSIFRSAQAYKLALVPDAVEPATARQLSRLRSSFN